jgi:glucoamylase
MTLLLPLVLAAYLVLYAFAFVLPPLPLPLSYLAGIEQSPLQQKPLSSLDEWLQREEDIAVDSLLANVAPFGRNVPDAAPGSVIASPSKDHPNYYFQC